ncbi:ATP-binding protein [Spongiactinospora sp. TRM90649]|uniref:ATP-binding protein n=1 Tax=Spongiactinospora sp. TRM90649 TaxID=3031114 RepID=UPI0023F7CC21|nr:ATP-binding protein [Spongiactinospora sp. TRM90649]MDF5757757.1 ATP-binding protein [Spongiactinospora sp. TRM90649]
MMLGRITLPGVAVSASVARHCARAILAAADHAEADDVLLLVTELVANAIRHSRSGRPGGVVALEIAHDTDAGELRIEVFDDGPENDNAPPPAVHEAAPGDTGGRGLWLVRNLAITWGTHEVGGGRAVWARLPLAHDRALHPAFI